jgi:hypothetical protein
VGLAGDTLGLGGLLSSRPVGTDEWRPTISMNWPDLYELARSL